MRRHAYSKTSVFVVHTRTIDLRFQKSQLSKAFSKLFVFEDFRFWKPLFFDRLSVDEYMQTKTHYCGRSLRRKLTVEIKDSLIHCQIIVITVVSIITYNPGQKTLRHWSNLAEK